MFLVLTVLATLLILTHTHPTDPLAPLPLLSSQESMSTPGYCWMTMYKQSNFQGLGLRIAFAEHYCYDLGVAQENLPDDYRMGVRSLDIERQCSCRGVYAATTQMDVDGDGVEGISGVEAADCEALDGGRVDWAMGRKELKGRLKEMSCSGAPNHG